ncbi:hypothetical protein D3C73_1673490 [compost metagenome]
MSVTCFLPSGEAMVPTVPVTPSTAGVSDVVVKIGHASRQAAVQALVPESLTSFVKK